MGVCYFLSVNSEPIMKMPPQGYGCVTGVLRVCYFLNERSAAPVIMKMPPQGYGGVLRGVVRGVLRGGVLRVLRDGLTYALIIIMLKYETSYAVA
jgi:hypothetical protein